MTSPALPSITLLSPLLSPREGLAGLKDRLNEKKNA